MLGIIYQQRLIFTSNPFGHLLLRQEIYCSILEGRGWDFIIYIITVTSVKKITANKVNLQDGKPYPSPPEL